MVHRRADDALGIIIERPRLDYLWSALIVGAHAGLVTLDLVGDPLGDAGSSGRRSAYKVLFPLALGLVATAWATINFYFGSNPGRRLADLRARPGKTVAAIKTSALVGFLVTAGALGVALVVDTPKNRPADITRWLVEAALLLGLIRLVRLAWLNLALVRLRSLDDQDPDEPFDGFVIKPRSSKPKSGGGLQGRGPKKRAATRSTVAAQR